MILRDLFPDMSGPEGETAVTGLTADSRKIEPGFVFAAMQGVVTDGRKFIGSAIGRRRSGGARRSSLPAIWRARLRSNVENARLALGRSLCAVSMQMQPETIVAITGTNGKSSTVDFLRQIWDIARS